MRRPGHGDARDLVAIAFVVVAGLGVFLFIPQLEIPSGAAATGIVALLVLKHLGLLAVVGAPLAGFVRSHVLPRLRRKAGEGG
jgi:hypothetical protein